MQYAPTDTVSELQVFWRTIGRAARESPRLFFAPVISIWRHFFPLHSSPQNLLRDPVRIYMYMKIAINRHGAACAADGGKFDNLHVITLKFEELSVSKIRDMLAEIGEGTLLDATRAAEVLIDAINAYREKGGEVRYRSTSPSPLGDSGRLAKSLGPVIFKPMRPQLCAT